MNKKESFVKQLRDLAQLIEERDFDFEEANISSTNFFLFCKNKEAFGRNSKALGSFNKDASTSWLNSTKSFGENINLQVTIERNQVCEKVKVGTKIIPAKPAEVIPEKTIPAQEEREEDVYEYKCPESFVELANAEL